MFSKSLLCGCFCVFLVVMFMPAGLLASELSEPSFEDNLREVLDAPISREDILESTEACPHDEFILPDGSVVELDSEELDPLTERILDSCPDLTNGELMAIQDMMGEQLDTPAGEDKFKFYINYLSNSSEPIFEGMTAHELFSKSKYYRDVHHHFEQIIINYGHMSSDSKVAFLMTQSPGLDVAMKILEDASVEETIYLTEHAFTALENLPEPYTGNKLSKIIDYSEELDKQLNQFYHDISFYHTKYNVYEKHKELDYSAMNKEELSKLPKEKLEEAEKTLNTQIPALNKTGGYYGLGECFVIASSTMLVISIIITAFALCCGIAAAIIAIIMTLLIAAILVVGSVLLDKGKYINNDLLPRLEEQRESINKLLVIF